MDISISLSPKDVWGYYKNHVKELEEKTKVVAYNLDFNTEIHICDGNGALDICVYLDNHEVITEETLNATETERLMTELYDTYIYNAENFVKSRAEQMEADEEEELIEERELELDDAVYEFLVTILGESFNISSKDTQEILENLKDCICHTLYEKHGINVYRPMYIADDDGNEEFCLYPYSEIACTK